MVFKGSQNKPNFGVRNFPSPQAFCMAGTSTLIKPKATRLASMRANQQPLWGATHQMLETEMTEMSSSPTKKPIGQILFSSKWSFGQALQPLQREPLSYQGPRLALCLPSSRQAAGEAQEFRGLPNKMLSLGRWKELWFCHRAGAMRSCACHCPSGTFAYRNRPFNFLHCSLGFTDQNSGMPLSTKHVMD